MQYKVSGFFNVCNASTVIKENLISEVKIRDITRCKEKY